MQGLQNILLAMSSLSCQNIVTEYNYTIMYESVTCISDLLHFTMTFLCGVPLRSDARHLYNYTVD